MIGQLFSKKNRLLSRFKKQAQSILEQHIDTSNLTPSLEYNSKKESHLLMMAITHAEETLGFKPHLNQIMAALAMCNGIVVEMATGEGKTLAAAMAAVTKAVNGEKVHVMTANNYLATRDAGQLTSFYRRFGLSVGGIQEGMGLEEIYSELSKDIVYGTASDFAYAYLRNNLIGLGGIPFPMEYDFLIIDEADSVLIDQARYPFNITKQEKPNVELYELMQSIQKNFSVAVLVDDIEQIDEADAEVDLVKRKVELTEFGHRKLESVLIEHNVLQRPEDLYIGKNLHLVDKLSAAIAANRIYKKGVNYIVENGNVILISDVNGRLLPGARVPKGGHQALEAKESVAIQPTTNVLARISMHNFVKKYSGISAMTGTISTEEQELNDVYSLEAINIPSNLPLIRVDEKDRVYLTMDSKYKAIVEQIKECSESGQPVLIGCTTIEESENLSNYLKSEHIVHELLNAKNLEDEAQVISKAGMLNQVTVATNVAGRGTDIVLGGAKSLFENVESWRSSRESVVEAGGLFMLGVSRSETRRFDLQFIGRSGRQGDPGRAVFFQSFDDELFTKFDFSNVKSIMERNISDPLDYVQHKMIDKGIMNAQMKVNDLHYQSRKSLYRYDDVISRQREIVYSLRKKVFDEQEASEVENSNIELGHLVLTSLFELYVPENSIREEWDVSGLLSTLEKDFMLTMPLVDWANEGISRSELGDRFLATIFNQLTEFRKSVGTETYSKISVDTKLKIFDYVWGVQLSSMNSMRTSIQLRTYGGKDPHQELEKEAIVMFEDMITDYHYESLTNIFKRLINAVRDLGKQAA